MSATAQLNTALAGRYAIEREIGRGGMATVYLARDLRHDRLVALKVLDPELGAVLGAGRFLSEIRVTANLQHPNLLPLFDSGEADGLLYYTMPYVRGESLRTRLDRERQLPIDDAIHIATAVAGALDYAHGEGVIHRDLKPENVLLTGGEPLVADFGIALAVSRAGGARVTQTGLSLGTPQYMSPEQATADRVIDGRTDVYSLGAVTYEMLTGEPPHMGTTAQAIIARVLTEPAPHVAATRPSVPSNVDHAVARALEKLPADRWPSARAFSDALQANVPAAGHSRTAAIDAPRWTTVRPSWRTRVRDPLVIALFCVLVGATGAAAWGWTRWSAMPRPTPVRLALALPPGLRLQRTTGPSVVISPDGRAVVFVASATNTAPQLYYRPMGTLDVRALGGTESITSAPFFSPDGAWIGFFSRGVLKKVSVDGGDAVALATLPGGAGGAWGANDVIVGGSNQGLWSVPAAGGAPRLITRVDTARGEFMHSMPQFLPDGRTVAFDIDRVGGIEQSQLGVVDVETGRVARPGVKLRNPVGYAAGMLIVGGPDLGLAGVPFDLRGWRVTGAPIALVQDVAFKFNGGAEASLASNGSLVYTRGAGNRLVLVDEHGAMTAQIDAPRPYYSVRFSPDGRRLALAIGGGGLSGGGATGFDVWTYDLASRTLSRLTSRGTAGFPSWTPDGSRVAYATSPKGAFTSATELWWTPADGSGSEERVFVTPRGMSINWPVTFTPDARHVVVNLSATAGPQEIWDVSLDRSAPAGRASPLVRSSFNNVGPSVSPDGHWLAYASNETGQYEVYVRPYPGPGGRVQVSTGGGWAPVWDRAGRQLFYRQSASGGPLLVATVAPSGTGSSEIAVRDRREVFPGASGATETVGPRSYDARGDGKSFAMIRPAADGGDEIVVALDWKDEVLARERAATHE